MSTSFLTTSIYSKPCKLTPIGQRIVEASKIARKALLFLDEIGMVIQSEEGKKQLAGLKDAYNTKVCDHEHDNNHLSFLTIAKSSNAERLKNELIKLLRRGLFTRYSDALAEICSEVRIGFAVQEMDEIVVSQTYWARFLGQLEAEEAAWKRKSVEECTTHTALIECCKLCGFGSLFDIISVIQQHGRTNERTNSTYTQLIKHADFDNIKHQLYKDLCYIPRLFEPSEDYQATVLLTIIDLLIDNWFHQVREDDVLSWSPKQELFDQSRALRSSTDIEANVVITKSIADKVIENLRAAEKRKLSRVVSSKLDEETDLLKTRMNEWKALESICGSQSTISDVYVLIPW